MVEDEALAAADEVEQSLVGAGAPAEFGLVAVEVIEDDEVIGGQCLGTGAAELFGDTDVEAAGILEDFAQHWRSAAPVVIVLSGDDESLQPGGLLRERRHGEDSEG